MIVCEAVNKLFVQGYESVSAVQGLSLHIHQGECVVLKGASGSGKSTLLSMIAGLMPPTSGKIAVNGKEISKLPEHFSAKMRRETIGFVFQKFHLLPHLSVQDNLILPLIPENITVKHLEEKASKMMERYALSNKANTPIHRLSGGEQQRVAIARALMHEPSILLADEPTANLDEALSLVFIQECEALKQTGLTLLIATHDPLFFDLPFVDRVIEMKHGMLRS